MTYDNSAVGNDPIIYVNNVAIDLTEDETPGGTVETKTFLTGVIANNDQWASGAGRRPVNALYNSWSYWDTVLTPAEVNELWNNGQPLADVAGHSAASNLKIWYTFENEPDVSTIDDHITDRTATLQNPPFSSRESYPQGGMDMGPFRWLFTPIATPEPRNTRQRLLIHRRHPKAGVYSRIYPIHRRL